VLGVVGLLGGCTSGAAPHRRARPAKLTLGCSTRTSPGKPLVAAPARTVPVPGNPFAALALPGGRWVVASLTVAGYPGNRGALAVLAVQSGAARLVRTVALPRSVAGADGMAVSHDGRLLLVAAQAGTAVVSVPALEDGSRHPVLGVLTDSGAGQAEVAVSGKGRYAFVTDETSGGLSVFNLDAALRRGFGAPGVAVGIVPLARGPVGVAVAPGGARLYVTTLGGYGDFGQLWAIGAGRAERGAGRSAVLGHAASGCQPVRVAVSPGGKTVWVTALQSNALLGFTAAALGHGESRAVPAIVPVGSEPVGLLLLDNGRTAVVADSNRGLVGSTGGNGAQRISVVSTAAALAGHQAVTGSLPAGLFPRDLGYDPATGQVLVANYLSRTVEFVRTPPVP
jgi:DNA-binding beta-propeller fold protein YncE